MGRFAAVQMTSGPDVAANLATVKPLIAAAADQGASVVLLPENFNFIGRRDIDKRDVAEVLGRGPTQDFLADAAQRHRLTLIGGTQPLQSDAANGRVTNSTLVYDPNGRCVARYDKIHLFDVDVPDKPGESYRESAHVAPGQAVVTVDTPVGRVGLSVCYDMRFPELYRRLVSDGAEILVMPAAFTVPTGRAHWEILLRARAIENLSYVVAAAQSGVHPNGRETYGDTLAIDPWGRVLRRLPRGSGVLCADVDREGLHRLRAEFPALSNRVLNA
jgi:deaminated glutathione amidase